MYNETVVSAKYCQLETLHQSSEKVEFADEPGRYDSTKISSEYVSFNSFTLTLRTLVGWLVSFYVVSTFFCLVSLFNAISTFIGYLMPKPFFQKNISNLFQAI